MKDTVMNRFLWIVCLLVGLTEVPTVFAQPDTTYYTITNKKIEVSNLTGWDSTIHKRTIVMNDESKTQITQNFYANGTIESETYFRTINSNKEKDSVIMHGKRKTYYPNGSLKHIMTYEHGKLHDTLFSYHANGEVKRVEVYDKGSMYRSQCYDEQGNKVSYYPFQVVPYWEGAALTYPPIAEQTGIEGEFRFNVLVGKDSKIIRIEKLEGSSNSSILEKSAIDMLHRSKWKTGKLEGEPIECWITIPVRFRLR